MSSNSSIDRKVASSLVSLALASILLAAGTLLFSLAIDRTVGLRPNWPAIDGSAPPRREPMEYPSGIYSGSLEDPPVDQNLRKLWEALQEEEATRLKFPIEIEEAMSSPADVAV